MRTCNYNPDNDNFDMDDPDFDERQSAQGYDGRRRDRLASFPSSVDTHLAGQSRPNMDAMRQAATDLAKNHCDVFALLMAAPLGVREVTFEHQDSKVQIVETKHHRLGVLTGTDVTTTTDTHIQRRRIRLV